MQSTLENKKKIEKSFIPKFIDNPHTVANIFQLCHFIVILWVIPKELNWMDTGSDFPKMITLVIFPRRQAQAYFEILPNSGV